MMFLVMIYGDDDDDHSGTNNKAEEAERDKLAFFICM